MTTNNIFERHNRQLIEGLRDCELPEAYFGIDPNDSIFCEPIK